MMRYPRTDVRGSSIVQSESDTKIALNILRSINTETDEAGYTDYILFQSGSISSFPSKFEAWSKFLSARPGEPVCVLFSYGGSTHVPGLNRTKGKLTIKSGKINDVSALLTLDWNSRNYRNLLAFVTGPDDITTPSGPTVSMEISHMKAIVDDNESWIFNRPDRILCRNGGEAITAKDINKALGSYAQVLKAN